MKNAWIDEKTIRNVVEEVNVKLTKFVGQDLDMPACATYLTDLLQNHPKITTTNVRDAIVWRYNLKIIEENNKIISIELSKLPWVIQ